MPERIVIAALRHESNTFTPVATPLTTLAWERREASVVQTEPVRSAM